MQRRQTRHRTEKQWNSFRYRHFSRRVGPARLGHCAKPAGSVDGRFVSLIVGTESRGLRRTACALDDPAKRAFVLKTAR